jgi:hypothetical protein
MEKLDLLTALQSSTQEDLEAVDAQIDALTKQLASLNALRRVLQIKLHGKLTRTRTPGSAKGKTKEYRIAAAKYLLHAGSVKTMLLARECNIPPGSMTGVIAHPWFEDGPNGVVLSKEGQLAVGN